jgi:hypothetical protein
MFPLNMSFQASSYVALGKNHKLPISYHRRVCGEPAEWKIGRYLDRWGMAFVEETKVVERFMKRKDIFQDMDRSVLERVCWSQEDFQAEGGLPRLIIWDGFGRWKGGSELLSQGSSVGRAACRIGSRVILFRYSIPIKRQHDPFHSL